MLTDYREHVAERAALGVPPLPLSAGQVAELVALLADPPGADAGELCDLLVHRVPPGVTEAARLKADFLAAIAGGTAVSPVISPARAVALLGTMLGGYNVAPLVALLDSAELAPAAVAALSSTLLVFDAFHDVADRATAGNRHAAALLASWANADWFVRSPPLPEVVCLTAFVVPGETNTDNLSPAPEAWSRPDIPLHARSMLQQPRGGDDPMRRLRKALEKGRQVAYVGDVVGTGSSRKSATNSLLWHLGTDIPHVPNKRRGGLVIAGTIAPIFATTLQDAGALPIECDVSQIADGDLLELRPHDGVIARPGGETVATFELRSRVMLDEVRAGGRLALVIGRGLTQRARQQLGLAPSELFHPPRTVVAGSGGFTLAQKIVGRACDVDGVRPGSYCQPRMSSVGSQDTTGAMTRDELEELACLGFSADLVMQSFCHTIAYPRRVDVELQRSLPPFMATRGGVSLRPGDGVIHSWLNRMLLPDRVGTGADSHTRFPLGISFPAGSGLVAFAAATGTMPLEMPESVLVRFSGRLRAGITLRDLVNAIPRAAARQGLLTVAKQGKQNIFSGRILEIEGLSELTVEQAFELSDSTAERSAAGCTIALQEAAVADYLRSNVAMLRWMVESGYGDARTLERRARAMEQWLQAPMLLRADRDADYTAVIEIDVDAIDQPLLACPNDPDDIRPLSEVAGRQVDEVFIGSCMTNIGHFRAAARLLEAAGEAVPTRLWVAPPTRMDEAQLRAEGVYSIFARAGARTELPGCSLCMGNQARVADGATVVSTSTRNFPNRLGTGAQVFLSSAEVAAVAALLGRLPTPVEYQSFAGELQPLASEIYRYLQFDRQPPAGL